MSAGQQFNSRRLSGRTAAEASWQHPWPVGDKVNQCVECIGQSALWPKELHIDDLNVHSKVLTRMEELHVTATVL